MKSARLDGQLILRIDTETLNKLDALAQQDGRSRSNLVQRIIKEYIKKVPTPCSVLV